MFFKYLGNKYWGFDEKRYRVEPGYPKLIKDFWIGVPDNIDGVFEWSNRNLYFFKGSFLKFLFHVSNLIIFFEVFCFIVLKYKKVIIINISIIKLILHP